MLSMAFHHILIYLLLLLGKKKILLYGFKKLILILFFYFRKNKSGIDSTAKIIAQSDSITLDEKRTRRVAESNENSSLFLLKKQGI